MTGWMAARNFEWTFRQETGMDIVSIDAEVQLFADQFKKVQQNPDAYLKQGC